MFLVRGTLGSALIRFTRIWMGNTCCEYLNDGEIFSQCLCFILHQKSQLCCKNKKLHCLWCSCKESSTVRLGVFPTYCIVYLSFHCLEPELTDSRWPRLAVVFLLKIWIFTFPLEEFEFKFGFLKGNRKKTIKLACHLFFVIVYFCILENSLMTYMLINSWKLVSHHLDAREENLSPTLVTMNRMSNYQKVQNYEVLH